MLTMLSFGKLPFDQLNVWKRHKKLKRRRDSFNTFTFTISKLTTVHIPEKNINIFAKTKTKVLEKNVF